MHGKWQGNPGEIEGKDLGHAWEMGGKSWGNTREMVWKLCWEMVMKLWGSDEKYQEQDLLNMGISWGT